MTWNDWRDEPRDTNPVCARTMLTTNTAELLSVYIKPQQKLEVPSEHMPTVLHIYTVQCELQGLLF